ncbi:MAG: TatD family hydrolase [Bdellovibrionota bacterium]
MGGVIHCFTGTEDQAIQFVELGAYISFSGVVTFKNTDELRCAVKSVPMDRMLVETDAPFLAPIPYRGKRNEPSYMVETARTIAAVKGISLEEVAIATTANAKKLFKF